jgi:hypothetical protein
MSRTKDALLATHELLRMEQAAFEAASKAHMAVMDEAPSFGETLTCSRCGGTGVTKYLHILHLGVPGGCFRCDCRGRVPSKEHERTFHMWVARAALARYRVLWREMSKVLKWGEAHGVLAESLAGLHAILASTEAEGKKLRQKLTPRAASTRARHPRRTGA